MKTVYGLKGYQAKDYTPKDKFKIIQIGNENSIVQLNFKLFIITNSHLMQLDERGLLL